MEYARVKLSKNDYEMYRGIDNDLRQLQEDLKQLDKVLADELGAYKLHWRKQD